MNKKIEYQKPEITLIELECETMIAGSNGLVNTDGKDFGGVNAGSNITNSVKIDLMDED